MAGTKRKRRGRSPDPLLRGTHSLEAPTPVGRRLVLSHVEIVCSPPEHVNSSAATVVNSVNAHAATEPYTARLTRSSRRSHQSQETVSANSFDRILSPQRGSDEALFRFHISDQTDCPEQPREHSSLDEMHTQDLFPLPETKGKITPEASHDDLPNPETAVTNTAAIVKVERGRKERHLSKPLSHFPVSKSPSYPTLQDLLSVRTVCDRVFSHLDNVSVTNLTKTSRFLAFSDIQQAYWDIDHAFASFFGPASSDFRQVLSHSHALITGPFALGYFSRLNSTQTRMDIYVQTGEPWKIMLAFLRKCTTLRAMGAAANDRKINRFCRTYEFCRSDRIARIFLTDDIPLQSLLSCTIDTAHLNIITGQKAYCLFPRTTFHHKSIHRFYVSGMPDDAKPNYLGWSWQENNMVSTPLNGPRIFSTDIEETRRIGDDHTWVIPFERQMMTGKPSAQVDMMPDTIECNTFSLTIESEDYCRRCRGNVGHKREHSLQIRTTAVSSPVLRHRYVCAASSWHGQFGQESNYQTASELHRAIERGDLMKTDLGDNEKGLIQAILEGSYTDRPFHKVLRRWYESVDFIDVPKDWLFKDLSIIGWYSDWWAAHGSGIQPVLPDRPEEQVVNGTILGSSLTQTEQFSRESEEFELQPFPQSVSIKAEESDDEFSITEHVAAYSSTSSDRFRSSGPLTIVKNEKAEDGDRDSNVGALAIPFEAFHKVDTSLSSCLSTPTANRHNSPKSEIYPEPAPSDMPSVETDETLHHSPADPVIDASHSTAEAQASSSPSAEPFGSSNRGLLFELKQRNHGRLPSPLPDWVLRKLPWELFGDCSEGDESSDDDDW